MREEELTVLLDIAARVQSDPDEALRQAEALQAKRAPRMDEARSARLRDGVAVISIHDELFPRADAFTSVSGGASCETLLQDFMQAMSDPAVRAVLFDIDSPGGDVTGVRSFADHIYAARGKKPLCAHVDGLCCSGAYWLASACDEIVVEPTAVVGSIGVASVYRDTKELDAKRGVTKHEFVSSQSPNKRPDPSTEIGKAQIQERVDALASVFVSEVARNRGVDEETVLSDFGRGGVLVGQAAVDAGLATKIGTFEGCLAELAGRGRARPAQSAHRGEDERMSLTWKDVTNFFAGHVEGAPPVDPSRPAEPSAPPSPSGIQFEGKSFATPEAFAEYVRDQAAANVRAASAKAEAEAFADSLKDRIIPAKRAGVVTAYLALSGSGNTEALAAFKSTFEDLPQHNLTREIAAAGGVQGLRKLDDAAEPPSDEVDGRRMAALLKMTPLGEAVFAANGKKETA